MKSNITLYDYFNKSTVHPDIYSVREHVELYGVIFKQISQSIPTGSYVKLQTYLSSKTLGNNQDYNYIYLDYMFLTIYGSRRLSDIPESLRFPYYNDYSREADWDEINREVARLILIRFAERWEKYLDELTLDYTPLNNYDMHEHEEVNSSVTISGNDEHTVQGFNSTTYQPESKNEDTHTTSGDAKDNYRDLNRYGNIGVTTSQQMLEAEIKLRDENIFIKRLMLDVANFITVGVYD